MIPSVEITDKGLIAPSREDISAGLWAMFTNAFGSDLSQDARTPQGQLVTSLTALLIDRDNKLIELGNNFDPRYSVGIWQEGLGAIYFLERKGATSSIAPVEFIGLQGVVIPEGFILVDESGFEWETLSTLTIGVTGSVTGNVSCTTTGPISAAKGTINRVKSSISGLDTVESTASSSPGSNQESRFDFEVRRAESVSANSKNTNNAVYGAVANIEGVLDAYVEDNPTDVSITVGETNYQIIRNSLLVSVAGGEEQEIAKQVLIKGGTGCSFNGNTTIEYKDEDSWKDFPPVYDIKILRPDFVDVYFQIRVVDKGAIAYNQEVEAKQKIVDLFSSGELRARIAGTVISADFMCGMERALRAVQIKISTDEINWVDILEFGVDQFPVTSTANVEVIDN